MALCNAIEKQFSKIQSLFLDTSKTILEKVSTIKNVFESRIYPEIEEILKDLYHKVA